MEPIDPAQLARLPQWAQKRISHQDAYIANLEKSLAAANAVPAGSTAMYWVATDAGLKYNLPSRVSSANLCIDGIEFTLRRRNDGRVTLQYHTHGVSSDCTLETDSGNSLVFHTRELIAITAMRDKFNAFFNEHGSSGFGKPTDESVPVRQAFDTWFRMAKEFAVTDRTSPELESTRLRLVQCRLTLCEKVNRTYGHLPAYVVMHLLDGLLSIEY